MRKCLCAVVAVVLGIISSSTALTKDLESLSAFVKPAYTAMNFAAICAKDNPFFLADTSGPRGTALHYAQHVKDEAIESLSEGEALAVLKTAADAARLVARQKLYQLAQPGDDSGTVSAIRDWCDQEVRHFILEFIRQHDGSHADIVDFLQRAKR